MEARAAVTETRAIRVEHEGGVARVVLNRPPLNVLNLETIRELGLGIQSATGKAGVRLIEIASGLPAAFSSGTEIREHFRESAPALLREFHALIRAVLFAPVPTVALVEGYCLGGGMELAMACDFLVAARDARFGQTEIRVGAFPPAASVLLPKLIPEKRALEMILTGKTITGEEAYRLGLVNRLAGGPDGGTLEEAAEKFRKAILDQSPKVVDLARRAVRLGWREALEGALREAERIYLDELLPTEDAEEGLRAFLGKRLPKWKGR